MPARLNVNRIQEDLHTKRFGKKIFFVEEVESTNEWATELAQYGTEEGTVALAETQTQGRGRLDRKWVSPKGGLWFSIVLRPKLTVAEAAKLVFVAGLAVAEVLDEKYGLKVETKWPNDVLIGGRKVCGILLEMRSVDEDVNFVVVGIGVNVNFRVERSFSAELRESATSIENELGRKVKLDGFFKSLLERLESLYDSYLEFGFAPILSRWKRHAGFLGHKVVVATREEELSGLALDIDDEGALVLKSETGVVKRVFVGDVLLQMSPM